MHPRVLLSALIALLCVLSARAQILLGPISVEPSGATAPSWRLAAFGGSSTIPTNIHGMGYDEQGRFTLQTPVGAFQIYTVGNPAVPTLYWPGTIVSNKLESISTITTLPASNITVGLGSERLNMEVVDNSLPEPMRSLQAREDRAGAAGIPYVADAQGTGGSNEPTDGVYFVQALVSGQASTTASIVGRYRTPAQTLTDLGRITATATLDFPSINAGQQSDLLINIVGVQVGDPVMLGLPAAPAAGLVFNAFVSAADTVTIRASNISAAAVNAASATYSVTRF